MALVLGVTWTGIVNSRRKALGVKVDWAYAPGDVKILTSSDGSNFEEAKCWQTNTRTEVAFEESFMFAAPRTVKAVTIAMRSPRSWGYFGINSATLIAEPGPFMLVRWVRPDVVLQLVSGSAAFAKPPVESQLWMASSVLLSAAQVSIWNLAWKPLQLAMAGRSCSSTG